MIYDAVITGAGTAGLTAAVYAARSGKKVLVLECNAFGGQITESPCVENYPGLAGISGMDFAEKLYEQAEGFGAEIAFGKVISSGKTEEGFFVQTEDEEEYRGKNLVIACGAKHRHLGLGREEELAGKGVSYCAVCDGAFYKGRDVAVAGGGSAALSDALYLAKTCRTVYLIHRRDTFRAEKAMVDRVKETENIICVMNGNVTELSGEKKLEGVFVTDKVTKETRLIEVSGLFVAVGMEPDNRAFEDLVKLDEAGYIIAGEDCRTFTKGVYAAGDCRTKAVRQLTTAAADGTVCGLAVGKE